MQMTLYLMQLKAMADATHSINIQIAHFSKQINF